MVQTLSRSEMQVHVNAGEFGRVSIRTAYGRDAISAQITLENNELRSALSVHAPSIEQKLGQDHGLRASVTVDTQQPGGNAGHRGGREADAQPERRAFARADTLANASPELSTVALSATPSPIAAAGSARLDIRI
jgi:hypothetical protein